MIASFATQAHAAAACAEPEVLWSEVTDGREPARVKRPTRSGVLWQSNEDEFALRLPGVARCSVNSGGPIRIARECAVGDVDLRLIVQGLPLAAYWTQRRFIALHAAAIQASRGAVVLAGNSCAGKSTLAAAMALRGFPILADEVVPLSVLPSGALRAHPGMHDVLLPQTAVAELGIEAAGLQEARTGLNRYYVAGLPRADAVLDVAAIYVIETHNRRELEAQVLSGQEKILLTLQHGFNRKLPERQAVREHYFPWLGAAFAGIRVVRVRRPERLWSGDALLERIEKDCRT